MISNAKTLRAKAKATLGGKPFKGGWLWPILLGIIVSAITSFVAPISFLVTAILGIAGATYYVALTRRTAEAKEIGVYFNSMKNNIGGNICLSLVYNLYLMLWALVPIVGIVKMYSYAMTFYIKVDHPELTSNEAITKSRQMMNGYKWKYFCLQLSFIGWDLLSICTFGILAFWIAPYKSAAYAQFYEELKAINANEIVAE